MSEPPKDPAAIRAGFDQAQAILRDAAPVVAEFWRALVANGVSEMAAAHIASEWFNLATRLGLKSD